MNSDWSSALADDQSLAGRWLVVGSNPVETQVDVGSNPVETQVEFSFFLH